MLLSANEAYARAAEDITVLTGVQVSGSTQQRLVHRQDLEPPAVDGGVKEMSLDGGKVRLRTPEGQPCQWRDYKGVTLHQCRISAFYKDNDSLVNWVNQPPLAHPLVCLGDGVVYSLVAVASCLNLAMPVFYTSTTTPVKVNK